MNVRIFACLLACGLATLPPVAAAVPEGVRHDLSGPVEGRSFAIHDNDSAQLACLLVVGAMRMATRGSARVILLTIAATTTASYNIYTSAGSPTDKVAVTLTVNSGVTVGSLNPANPGIVTGSGWANGSTIRIVNNGHITSRSGQGGQAGFAPPAGTPLDGQAGSAGGDAIYLSWPVTINNSGGYIFGAGGGGGGGGGAGDGGANFYSSGGGGGGGGAGYTNNVSFGGGGGGSPNGSNGSDGTLSAGGAGGAPGDSLNPGGWGGFGGNPGEAGQAGSGGGGGYGGAGGAGGAAGYAVRLNGHAVTWEAGYNGTQVKGGVA